MTCSFPALWDDECIKWICGLKETRDLSVLAFFNFLPTEDSHSNYNLRTGNHQVGGPARGTETAGGEW